VTRSNLDARKTPRSRVEEQCPSRGGSHVPDLRPVHLVDRVLKPSPPSAGSSVRSPNGGYRSRALARGSSREDVWACPWATWGVRESVSRGSVPLFLTKGGQLLDSWAHRPVRVQPKRESPVRSASIALELIATKGFPRPFSSGFAPTGCERTAAREEWSLDSKSDGSRRQEKCTAGSDLVS
jgi:hypothetical protein